MMAVADLMTVDVKNLRQRYRRYAGLFGWLSRQLWVSAGWRVPLAVGVEAMSKLLNMGGFVLTINILLWIILESSRPRAIRQLFAADGGSSIYVIAIISVIPLVFLLAAALRLVANVYSHRIAVEASRQLLLRYLQHRFIEILGADLPDRERIRQFKELTSSEEDKLFNACFSASLAFMRFLGTFSVAMAAFIASIALEPVAMSLFLPFIAVFAAAYILFSYSRSRDDKVRADDLQQNIKEYRTETSKLIADRDGVGDLDGFFSDYTSLYGNRIQSLAHARHNTRMHDEFWRELFTAFGSGLLVLIIYLRGPGADLPVLLLTMFFFLFRFGVGNLVSSFSHISSLNVFYLPLRQLHAGIDRHRFDDSPFI